MSAAVAHHHSADAHPAQMGLEGLPPAPVAAHIKLSIVGILQRPAQLRVSESDGSAHLVIQVRQPKDGLPFIAVYHRPAGQRADIEEITQRMSTPGAAVLLVGRGIELDESHGHQVLRLVHCDHATTVVAADFLTDHQVDHQEA